MMEPNTNENTFRKYVELMTKWLQLIYWYKNKLLKLAARELESMNIMGIKY